MDESIKNVKKTGIEGSGKNPKSGFFLLGLKYTLRTKTQNNDMFISPKRKKTILEMALKSFIISKLIAQLRTGF